MVVSLSKMVTWARCQVYGNTEQYPRSFNTRPCLQSVRRILLTSSAGAPFVFRRHPGSKFGHPMPFRRPERELCEKLHIQLRLEHTLGESQDLRQRSPQEPPPRKSLQPGGRGGVSACACAVRMSSPRPASEGSQGAGTLRLRPKA